MAAHSRKRPAATLRGLQPAKRTKVASTATATAVAAAAAGAAGRGATVPTTRTVTSTKNGDEPWYSGYAGGRGPHYQHYMDREWGMPIQGPGRSRDNKLFEMLSLEGAQAGLSWDTILKKREAYRRAFDNFDIAVVAAYTERKVEALLNSPGEGNDAIVRNRGKIKSVVANARCCLQVAEEHGSLCNFLWSFVGGRPKENRWKNPKDIPAITEESKTMSKTLKKQGFRFVGPSICYAFMQSTGMVNDHPVNTPQWERVHRFVTSRYEPSR